MVTEHNEGAEIPKIVHYLSIQEAKRVFKRNGYGVCQCDDIIPNYSDFGLTPLLILGVMQRDLPVTFQKYCSREVPFSATTLLHEFWTKVYSNPFGGAITGIPDLLVIDCRLKSALNPNFFRWLEQAGVPFEYSNGKDRKFTAKVRNLQALPNLLIQDGLDSIPDIDLPFPEAERYPLTIPVLNRSMIGQNRLNYSLGKATRETMTMLFPKEETRRPLILAPVEDDYNPLSSAFYVPTSNPVTVDSLGWRCSSPSEATYNKTKDYPREGYLVANYASTSAKESFFEDLDLDDYLWSHDLDSEFEALKIALKCSFALFPEELRRIPGNNRLSLAIDALLKDDYAQLGHGEIDILRTLLGLKEIEWPASTDKTTVCGNRGPYLGQLGFVFHVSKLSRKEMILLWSRLQIEAAEFYELLPITPEAVDPAFRIIMKVTLMSRTTFYVRRGSEAAYVLDADLMNDHLDKVELRIHDKSYQKILSELSVGHLDKVRDLVYRLDWSQRAR